MGMNLNSVLYSTVCVNSLTFVKLQHNDKKREGT